MWRKWTNRIFLVVVVGGVFLVAPAVLDQPEVLAGTEGNIHEGVTIPPNEGPIGAQAAPALEILAPSEASRPDFARDMLGDPWDMQNANDVDYMDHVENSSFSAAGWYGEVEQGTVANIALFTPGGPGNPPSVGSINGSKYYHFTYDLYVQRSNSSDSTNQRIIYLTKWPFQDGTQHCSAALPLFYNQWHTYYYDLRTVPGGTVGCGGTWNWTGQTIKALLVWPHEQWNSPGSGRGPQYFMYRNISLKGDNKASTSYDIGWCVADSDGDTITTTLYYDTDTNWGNGEEEIGSVSTQPVSYSRGPYKVYLPILFGLGSSGSGSTCSLAGGKQATYPWDTSGVANGTYYIWFEATDGNSPPTRSVSTVPVYVAH